MNSQELEKKYEELGKENERLKKQKETDIIYLLSIKEYLKYKENIPLYRGGWWWLRSAGSDRYEAAHVYRDDSASYFGNFVYDDEDCVRPALDITNLKSSNLTFVDDNTLIHCGVTWKRIDTDLFITEVPIVAHRFDEKSNDYESSEIRRFLLD